LSPPTIGIFIALTTSRIGQYADYRKSRSKSGLVRACLRFVLVHWDRKRDRIGQVIVEVIMIQSMFKRRALVAGIALVAISVMPFTALAQTQIKYHPNKYSPQDDVKLGRQAAQEAERQLPLLQDETVRSYVESVGRRLVAAIPSEFQHPEFQYYF